MKKNSMKEITQAPKEIDTLTYQELRKASYSLAVPFQLQLVDHEEPVVCTQILRMLPKKRLVVFGTWKGKQIVAKLFFKGRRAKQEIERDVQGIETLKQANIPTAALYYQGMTRDKHVHVLLFERILDSKNVHEIWQETTQPQAIADFWHALIVELATQHVVGVLQKDLHFKNFLMSGNKIFTLDGSDICKFDEPLNRKMSFDNLALLVAQLGVDAMQYFDTILDIYAKLRGWRLKEADYLYMKKTIAQHQKNRWANFQEKIFRNCSAFATRISSSSIAVYDRNYDQLDLKRFLIHPEEIFDHAETQYLKKGNSATVIKTVLDGREVVIKRYNIKNFKHGLRRCLRPTRAATSWRLAQYLSLMKIPTAKPVAFIEERFLGLRTRSYFVMEYIPGIHAGQFFEKADAKQEPAKRLAKKMVMLLNHLAHFRLLHGDLKKTNFIINQNEPKLIDLDGMREYKLPVGFEKAFEKDIQRFLKNWEYQPEVKALFLESLKRMS